MDPWHAEFRHPRLVEIYDAECPWSRDDEFFLGVVNETPAARVLDLGCGTGRLATGLARAGHTVTGVDPARASLDAARARPDADRVTWIEGTSETLPEAAFDVAVMTSHVAQMFLHDDAWLGVLADLHRALRPGGRLAFDSRDPEARGWERWNPAESRRRVSLGDGRHADVHSEVTLVENGVVTFVHHYRFGDGDELQSRARLRFRSEAEIRSALSRTGFEIEVVFGGWRREPVGRGDGELLFVARRLPGEAPIDR